MYRRNCLASRHHAHDAVLRIRAKLVQHADVVHDVVPLVAVSRPEGRSSSAGGTPESGPPGACCPRRLRARARLKEEGGRACRASSRECLTLCMVMKMVGEEEIMMMG